MSYQDFAVQVRVGSSIDTLRPAAINEDQNPVRIQTDLFDGYISVRLRGVYGHSSYFDQTKDTFCIQIIGRFLHPCTADDILFGNQFDRPLRLPYGASIGIQFLKWFDPGLVCDLYAAEPYAFSPLIVTMNRLAINPNHSLSWPSSQGQPAEEGGPLLQEIMGPNKDRKRYFTIPEHREALNVKENHIWSMDFCNQFIDASKLALKVPGFSISILPYWDGQPWRFIAKTRDGTKTFFVIEFNLEKKSTT